MGHSEELQKSKKARKKEKEKEKERTHFSYVTAMKHLLLAVSFRLFRGWDFPMLANI